MQNLKKRSLGLVALLTLPVVQAYECKIDLQHNYSGHNVYLNNSGDAYATVDYADKRYDKMEYIYDLRRCEKVSDGVKQKSNIQAVLDKNGFRLVNKDGDLSPWLTHYYRLNEQKNQLVFNVEDVSNQEQQGLKELFAYSRDKSSSLSSAAETVFKTKYAKTPQFKSAIVSRYFQSQNFRNYATQIEQELLRSPANLKNNAGLYFLTNTPFKLVARNSQNNQFKITLESEEKLNLGKIPTIVMNAECKDVAVGQKYRQQETKGVWLFSADYEQEVVDKTVACSLNGQKSDTALKASLTSAASILGVKADISFNDHALGTNNKTVVLSERKIEREVLPEVKARAEEYKRCSDKLSNCENACPFAGWLYSSEEKAEYQNCLRKCKMIHACD